MMTSPIWLVDITKDSDASDWQIEDDRVMGGVSRGHFKINNQGNGEFYGHVTTENNGGFSSVELKLNDLDIGNAEMVHLFLKGDGKNYQFRIKVDESQRHSYIHEFSTSGEWQEITLPLADFYPSWRGRKLDMPNFEAQSINKIRFLIGNKKEQNFKLLIDKVVVK